MVDLVEGCFGVRYLVSLSLGSVSELVYYLSAVSAAIALSKA